MVEAAVVQADSGTVDIATAAGGRTEALGRCGLYPR